EPPKNKVLEAPVNGHAVYYHRLGTDQSADARIYERPDLPGYVLIGTVTEDGRYLLVMAFQGSGNENRLYYADLVHPDGPKIDAPIRPIIETDEAEYLPIGNADSILYLRSDKDAPNRKI